MDLYSTIDRSAELHPEATALIFRDTRTSYGELAEQIRRCACGLARLGVGRGDKVAIVMRNCPEFVIAYYALARLAAVAVPVNFLLKASEMSYIMSHGGVVGAITQEAFLPTIRQFCHQMSGFRYIILANNGNVSRAEVSFDALLSETEDAVSTPADGEDVVCVLYTSGTTGKPKGVMLTHENILSNAEACVRVIEVKDDDVFVCLLPMFHTLAWTTCVVLPLSLGNPVVIVESIQPFSEVATQCRKHRVSIFVAVPQVFSAMARLPFWRPLRFLLPLRVCVSGAGPLPRGVLEQFENKFGLPLLEGYGLTEASPVVSLNPLIGEHRPGTVGLALPGVEVRVVLDDNTEAPHGEVGEICVRGPNVMRGYYSDPLSTRDVLDPEGWLHTGDLGRFQWGGYLEIVDRAKDLIIVKGLNVYPREVEDVLLIHSDVEEVAVVGIPKEDGDETIKAFVVFKQGRAEDKAGLMTLCRENLASYKWPREIVGVASLPKNAIGKVLKRELARTLHA